MLSAPRLELAMVAARVLREGNWQGKKDGYQEGLRAERYPVGRVGRVRRVGLFLLEISIMLCAPHLKLAW